jgi:O-succinylbenzoate synthase
VNSLKDLRSEIGEAAKIRLDANRAWTLEEAVEFGNEVRGLNIEYIEEPLRDPRELEVFHRRTGLMFAWDESLLELTGMPDGALPEGLAAVILKPAILGGVGVIQSWIRAAEERKIDWVVTSCFESGVGLRNLARTCWLNGAGTRAMGLATADYFERDVLVPALSSERGAIDLGESFSSEILIL